MVSHTLFIEPDIMKSQTSNEHTDYEWVDYKPLSKDYDMICNSEK